ncbi:MAG: hypothetical protein COB78_04775 [Hyphomicrobiales bacterium]|nr:MAG: hypothetical protein COB78_04775 [Hyphomicrobiales bacterium]
MRVFILGATGSIGQSIVLELKGRGHEVVALARSDISEANLVAQNIEIIRGDLRDPAGWVKIIHEIDAIIHVAATFTDDMGFVDHHLVETLIAEAEPAGRKIRFIYTGGCWLFGETGDEIATEESVFNPPSDFEQTIENSQLLFDASCFDTIVIHPASVYHRDGGVVSRFLSSAQELGRVEVWGSLQTRWSVVHREDLARAYLLVLEQGQIGQSYCVAAETGVWVSDMVAAVSQRFKLNSEPWIREVSEVVAEHGEWASGPAIDQQMSGSKIMNTLGWAPIYNNILSEIG